MPQYKLYYFDARGRAELIRLLFAAGNVEYEDIRIKMDEWPAHKANMPFGQMPVLQVDGVKIAQGNAIARYVARETGRYPSNSLEAAKVDAYCDEMDDIVKFAVDAMFQKNEEEKERLVKLAKEKIPARIAKLEEALGKSAQFLVGDKMTVADVKLMNMIQGNGFNIKTYIATSKIPNIDALVNRIAEIPGIKKWIAERPETQF